MLDFELHCVVWRGSSLPDMPERWQCTAFQEHADANRKATIPFSITCLLVVVLMVGWNTSSGRLCR